jgi:hypothetical protein
MAYCTDARIQVLTLLHADFALLVVAVATDDLLDLT